MEGEEQIGKYLVAGPAVYQITGVTAAEVVTVVLRPARRRPLDWPADKAFVLYREVRWPRRMLRLSMQRRELRLTETLPTPEEVEAERAGKLAALLQRDRAARRNHARERPRQPAPTDEWGRPLALPRPGRAV